MNFVLKAVLIVAMLAGALLVNGVVASLEDELPGGFNNPDGGQPLSTGIRKAQRILGFVAVLALIPITFLGVAAIVRDSGRDRLFDAGLTAGAGSLALAIVLRRRKLFWLGAAFIGAGIVSGALLR